MNRQENVAANLARGLAEEVVRTFGEIRIRVFGTSMVPSILPGDLISVQRAGVSEISTGEIVVYSREGRIFAHRVVGCAGERLLVTRGDRLRYNDPAVSSAELLGRVTSIERGNFQKRPATCLGGWERLIGRLLRQSDHATYLYVRLVTLSHGWARSRQRGMPLQMQHQQTGLAVDSGLDAPAHKGDKSIDEMRRNHEEEGVIECRA